MTLPGALGKALQVRWEMSFLLNYYPQMMAHRESVETDFEVISLINQCVCSGWRCGCSLRAHILHSWNILKLCLTTCSFRSVPCPNACAFACAPPSAWHTLLGLASLPARPPLPGTRSWVSLHCHAALPVPKREL